MPVLRQANNIRYLKASKDPVYEVWQINAYPTTTNAVQVVTTLIYAWTSDTILKGRRWPPIIFGAVCPRFALNVNTMLMSSDNKHHLLRLPSNLGHPHRLALGLLYSRWFRIRLEWFTHGMDARDLLRG